MKGSSGRLYTLAFLIALTWLAGAWLVGSPRVRMVRLYAQILPRAATATWNPNPATDNVIDYQLTLDAGTPLTLLATACSATTCSQAISLTAFGSHTVSVVARNLSLSTDPTSLQASLPTSVMVILNRAPGGPANVTVR